MNPKRILCILYGCNWGEHAECPRCNANAYEDARFRDSGWLDPLVRLQRRVRDKIVGRPCAHCGKRMFFRSSLDSCCSEDCYQHWIPF